MTPQAELFDVPAPKSVEVDALGFLIKGYGDIYRIFDGGRVFNMKKNRFISLQKTKLGYVHVSFWHNKKAHGRFVHRLLMQAVTGIDGGDLEVNHIDGNPSNNFLSNLEWVTCSENKVHSCHVLNHRPVICRFGSENFHARPVESFGGDGVVVQKFDCAESARQHGFQPPSIAHAIKGVYQKKHKGLFWRYSENSDQLGNGSLSPGWVGV
mgnify:CR=1 FL=1